LSVFLPYLSQPLTTFWTVATCEKQLWLRIIKTEENWGKATSKNLLSDVPSLKVNISEFILRLTTYTSTDIPE